MTTRKFATPHDVVVSRELSREQKINVLQRWEYDVRELMVADDENMPGPPTTSLQEIHAALHELNAPEPLSTGGTKHG